MSNAQLTRVHFQVCDGAFPKKVVQKFPSHGIRTNTFEGEKCYTQISSHKNYDLESWIHNEWTRNVWIMSAAEASSLRSRDDFEDGSLEILTSSKDRYRGASVLGMASDQGPRARHKYELEVT